LDERIDVLQRDQTERRKLLYEYTRIATVVHASITFDHAMRASLWSFALGESLEASTAFQHQPLDRETKNANNSQY